jgi:energy-coupling factor transporter ATP-binding protein EcfA2
VAFGPRNLGYPPDRVTALVAAALEQSGLSDLADHNPRDLGYSQRKLLAFASILAMDTPILALDEPTAGLDAGELARLAAILAGLRLAGKTVLLITHDLDFAAETTERAVLLEDGLVIACGPVGQILSDAERLSTCGLVGPQITRLSASLGLPEPAMTVDALVQALAAQKKT